MLEICSVKVGFVTQISNDESIKSEINVDMSDVVNEQEETIEADYKEVRKRS